MNAQTINALTMINPGAAELNTRVVFWSKFAGQYQDTPAYDVIMANIQAMEAAAHKLERKPGKPAAVKISRSLNVSAVEFWQQHAAAVRSIVEKFGLRWYLQEDHTIMATIPAKLRSYKSERGTTIKFRADQRLPTAQYWPTGAIPGDGMIFATACGPVPEFNAGADMLRRMLAARTDQIEADRVNGLADRLRKAQADYDTTCEALEFQRANPAIHNNDYYVKGLETKLKKAIGALRAASREMEAEEGGLTVEEIDYSAEMELRQSANMTESECETMADEIASAEILADCNPPAWRAEFNSAWDDLEMINWIETELTTVRVPLSAPAVWARDYSMDMDRLEAALAEVWESDLADETAVRVAPAPAAPTRSHYIKLRPASANSVRSSFAAARAAMLADYQDAAD